MNTIYTITDFFKSNEPKSGTSMLNDLISKNFAKKNPWFGKHKSHNDEIDEIYKAIFGEPKKEKITTKSTMYIIEENPYNNINDTMSIDDIIDLIINLPEEKKYDFKLDDGTPVKFYDDRIQIGYEVIPFGHTMFSYAPEKTKKIKKTITDIYINIK